MQVEIEAKFTDIDVEAMRQRLRGVGAELVHPERLMKRHNFDNPAGKNTWVRVRDEGDKVTMSYKQTLERTLHGTQEINLVVDDFDRATEFLEAIGLHGRVIQETKREEWHLNGCEVTIDTWPVITFVPVPEWLEKTRK